MKKLTHNYTIRLSDFQIESFEILRKHDIDVAKFVRSAIKEKITRDWPKIKEQKQKTAVPF